MIYQFTDNLSEEDFEEELEEMDIIWKEHSYLPYDVLIDYDGIKRKRENNSPRIMISLDEHYRDIVPISIDKNNPEILIDKEIPEFEIMKNWIKSNYDILIRHWNQEINGYQLLSELAIKKG